MVGYEVKYFGMASNTRANLGSGVCLGFSGLN
jgi:hypothetical protein